METFWALAADIGIVVAFTVVATAAHALVLRRIDRKRYAQHNDVAGFIFSVVGVLYAVVLGFVVIVAWQKYDQAGTYVDDEVSAVADLYRSVSAMPDPPRVEAQRALRTYVRIMANNEWSLMSMGQFSNQGMLLLERVSTLVNHFQPKTAAQSDVHQQAMTQVQRLMDARRHRTSENAPSVPDILWMALFAGAAGTLGCAFLFGVENRSAQLLMTAILAGLIGVLFVVIWEFDLPFQGAVSVAPQGWHRLDSRIQYIK